MLKSAYLMKDIYLIKHASSAPGLRLFGLGPAFKPMKGLKKLQFLFNQNALWAKDRNIAQIKKMLAHMQKWQKIRMMGSAAMAACYVATGRVEQYQEKGIYLWDVIAGAAIVESSGGVAEISNQRENYQVDVVFSNSKI